MRQSNFRHRAVRLLGAVAVTGVLSAGVLTTAPAAADTTYQRYYSGTQTGSGTVANGLGIRSMQANGL